MRSTPPSSAAKRREEHSREDGVQTASSLQDGAAAGVDPSPPRSLRRIISMMFVFMAAIALAGWSWWRASHEPAEEGKSRNERGAPVVTAALVRGDMEVERSYPGEVFADAVDLSSRIAGHVSEIGVRIGDEVEQGDVIARIDTTIIERQIRETQAQVRAEASATKSAAIAEEAASRDLQRVRDLFERKVISQQELDDMQTALRQRQAERTTSQARRDEARARLALLRENRKDATIRAPFAGVIARRDVDPGAFVQPGTPVARIVAREPLRVRFKVAETQLAGVAEGLKFELRSPATATEPASGHVTHLSGEVSRDDRSLPVEGVLDEAGALRPGMYVDVVLALAPLNDVIIAPEAAVVERVDARGRVQAGLFVLAEDRARFVRVHVLGRRGERVAVQAVQQNELDASAQVLVRGHRELADDARVEVVEEDAGEAKQEA